MLSAPSKFVLLLGLLYQGYSHAQQTPYVGLFQENWVLLNPAFLDHAQLEKKDNTFVINSSYRQQWWGFEGGPRQMNVRFEHIVTTDKRGAWDQPMLKWGLGFSQDQIASFSTSGLFGNFSYLAALGKDMNIGGGFNFGVQSQGLQLKNQEFQNWAADVFAQGLNGQQQWIFNADGGIFFRRIVKTNRRFYDYYGGVSATQLLSVKLGANSADTLIIRRNPHFNVLFGGLIKGDSRYGNSYLEPSIWLRHVPGVRYLGPLNPSPTLSIDLSLRIHLESQFWVGGGYSTAGSINAAFGYQYISGRESSKRIKGGMLMSIPLHSQALGYGLEAFLGLALHE